MKKTNLSLLTLLFCMLLLLFACRKDIEYFIKDRDSAPSSQLENAKIWRFSHLKKSTNSSKGILNPNWDHSWVVKSTQGNFIIVPAPEMPVQNRSFSIRRFFIFATSGKIILNGKIVELIGDNYNVEEQVDHLLKNMGKHTIEGFNGIIADYDINYLPLKTEVYRRGIRTDNNVKIKTERSILFVAANRSSLSVTSSSCDPVTPINIGFPNSMCPDGFVTWVEETTTDPDGCVVSVINRFVSIWCPGSGGNGSSGSGSGSGGGTSNPPYAGGGSGGGNPPTFTTELLITSDGPIVTDIEKYLKCFNGGSDIILTLYIDQPVENQAATWSGIPTDPNVGHTFVSIQQGSNIRVLGYYPGESVNPFSANPTSGSVLRNDSGHDYDVKMTFGSVPANKVAGVLDYIKNYPATYNLNTYNCTDFAIKVSYAAGYVVPDVNGQWPGGGGSNPGNLGQSVRALSNSSGVTIVKTAGVAVSNVGNCP